MHASHSRISGHLKHTLNKKVNNFNGKYNEENQRLRKHALLCVGSHLMESQKGLSEEVTLELKLQDEVCGISVLAM